MTDQSAQIFYDETDLKCARDRLGSLMRNFDDLQLASACRERALAFIPSGQTASACVAYQAKTQLANGRPFSLVRVGDAEGIMLALAADPENSIRYKNFVHTFLMQNGLCLEKEAAVNFCRIFTKSILSADVIGFRSFDLVAQNDASDAGRLVELNSLRGALGILDARSFLEDGLSRGRFANALITTAFIHLPLIEYINDLVRSAQGVIVVSARSELEPEFRRRFGSKLRHFLQIPLERFAVSKLEDEAHYPAHFQRVLSALSDDLKGVLVLAGAGFFAKIYCAYAKIHGGVALDLGSAFDVLANVSTRGVHAYLNFDKLRWI